MMQSHRPRLAFGFAALLVAVVASGCKREAEDAGYDIDAQTELAKQAGIDAGLAATEVDPARFAINESKDDTSTHLMRLDRKVLSQRFGSEGVYNFHGNGQSLGHIITGKPNSPEIIVNKGSAATVIMSPRSDGEWKLFIHNSDGPPEAIYFDQHTARPANETEYHAIYIEHQAAVAGWDKLMEPITEKLERAAAEKGR